MLFTFQHFSIQPHFVQPRNQCLVDLVDDFLAVAPRFVYRVLEHLVAHGIHGTEHQVFELVTDGVNTKTVRNWNIYFQRFLRDASPLVRSQCTEGTHVVQTISQFDEDDANVFCHRQQHLLHVLGLLLYLVLEFEVGKLADAIDKMRHVFTKFVLDYFTRGGRIFEYIVQD